MVELTQVTALPPDSGVAVKVYLAHGPPVLGAAAVAVPELEPVATALVSVGAELDGWTRVTGAEAGVTVPSARVAVAVMVYLHVDASQRLTTRSQGAKPVGVCRHAPSSQEWTHVTAGVSPVRSMFVGLVPEKVCVPLVPTGMAVML